MNQFRFTSIDFRIPMLFVTCLCAVPVAAAEPDAGATEVLADMTHLRSGDAREWTEFPEVADAHELTALFQDSRNEQACTLCIRQENVKQTWRVSINETNLAELIRDENPQWTWLEIPAGTLIDGENTLAIVPQGDGPSDDIRVGRIRVIHRPLPEALGGSRVELRVVDADAGMPIPSRITIVDADGVLHPAGIQPDTRLAVRTGVIYTASGEVELNLPPGRYTVYAGRGFEYSLAQVALDLRAGDAVQHTLTIRREVPTEGFVACDPHIHTLTFSGHGDATIAERMVTIAGEGLELAIATDHNVHIDYEPHAAAAGVRAYFTPVMGNEVTTPVGHFNVFPVAAGSGVPEFQQASWGPLFDEIFATPDVRVTILNHARDLHSGVRPFGPDHFNEAAGVSLDDWPYRMTGMEIINSGAVQTDPLQLTRDWMTLLNAGYSIAPVGSSDSHDAARHFVGQGRTYIRCDDSDPGRIDVNAAVESFLKGRVMVSYGLLAELNVDDRFSAGDLATTEGDFWPVRIRVLGPHWSDVESVRLYANGELIQEWTASDDQSPTSPGVRWEGGINLRRMQHDQHLVAVAIGPGIRDLYWPTARPYQPTSPEWEPHTLGISGAVYLDADGDGAFSPAREYARQIWSNEAGDFKEVVHRLSDYDSATATQVAALYHAAGGDLRSDEFQDAMTNESEIVQSGFGKYFAAWRDNQVAGAGR